MASSSSSSSFQFPTRSYRPLQCPTCKDLLLNPVTLPCGFSVCQACLPPPQTIAFQQQIKCPFRACSRSTLHLPDQLSIDVTLQNLTTALRTASQRSRSLANILSEDSESAKQHRQPDTLFYGNTSSDPAWNATLEGLYDPYEAVATAQFRQSASQTISPRNEEAAASQSVHDPIPSSVFYRNLASILDIVRPKIQQEIECQVCFLVFEHPITTYCGHTLCRSCLITALDHKPNCPLCRRTLPLYMHYHNQPPNKALVRFIQYLASHPNAKNETSGEVQREEREIEHALSMTPLFINSLVFPRMPCYLLVFEPRYRKLLRNVLKTQSRLFGMVLPPQPKKHRDLECTAWEPSMEYGTLLKVLNCELLPDGRALVETVGVARFQILTYSMMDGYYAATAVELIQDIPPEQELGLEKKALQEALEAAAQQTVPWRDALGYSEAALAGIIDGTGSIDLSSPQSKSPQGDSRTIITSGSSHQQPAHSPSDSSVPSSSNSGSQFYREPESETELSVQDLEDVDLETLPRKQLMEILKSWVVQMQDRIGALHTARLQREFGEMVEDDGQAFSFWVASVLPLKGHLKYELLHQTSVRRRLITVLSWIKEMESRRSLVGCMIS
ncbi:hypothetical protein BGX34_000368 [Mortierella sp. NVP85]|nr:hypothetical protein BGX34_000368 [Mortierella sp. NVP85]